MQLINYILLTIAIYFGTIIGIILCMLAPEEMKELTKYFKYISAILFIIPLIIVLSILKYENILLSVVFLIIGILLCWTLIAKTKSRISIYYITYANIFLAVLFFLSTSFQETAILIFASTTMIYFSFISSYLINTTKEKKHLYKNYFKIILINISFIIISIILRIIFNPGVWYSG